MQNTAEKPQTKPKNPNFSSGPCTKRPGWNIEDVMKSAQLGRSHRAGCCKAQLKDVIERQKAILGIPENYKIGIMPGSDTGAFEAALWSMIGERGVDVLAWENFSNDWMTDLVSQIKPDNLRTFDAEYGVLPDLGQVNFDHDVVFPWNGTTSGVRVPNGDWIAADRAGLTFCDATSAVFACDMPWDKLDVTTWSWQKVLGGEAAHGMLVLSPRAVERLESFTPDRPLPKLFRMTKKGQEGHRLNEGIFEGSTINTPSMLAVADVQDTLRWAENMGGLRTLIARSEENFKTIENWMQGRDWIDFLAQDPETRSTTSVCLKMTDPWFTEKNKEEQSQIVADLCKLLEEEQAAYDIKAYRTAPPGLRIWCGSTVQASDVEALLPWIDWAYESVKQADANKAAA